MSRVRDLFHRASPQRSDPSPLAAVALAENVAPVSALPEFPVEQVRVHSEERLVFHSDPHGPAADRFRFLRMQLRELRGAAKLKSLLVTSPLAHDGKSTILLNLATALSERGKHSVLVVDADLHHSFLTVNFRLNPWAGLSECLDGGLPSPLSAIRRIEPLGWYLLPAGRPARNPTELLHTPVFGDLLQTLSPSFDWILIDSPPTIPLTDALSMNQHADGSLLVVRAGHTPREAVEQAIALLGQPKVLGIVLNRVEGRNDLYYKYRSYDSGAYSQDG
jgi:capsular exopolysaccharide synthesis family protein